MRHLISWTPRAQWSPRHLKLVAVYVLVLLVSFSFASGQSRPFKHQIDNRSVFISVWNHDLSGTMTCLKGKIQLVEVFPFGDAVKNCGWPGPEIDPFWYVGRGVRPIGRFGKRQMRSSRGSLRPVSRHLDFILNALWEQKVSDTEDNDW